MARGGNWLTACPLGPRCDPMCSESKLAEGDAAEGFCEVRHPRQTRRTEQPKGGETVRASEMTRAWFRPRRGFGLLRGLASRPPCLRRAAAGMYGYGTALRCASLSFSDAELFKRERRKDELAELEQTIERVQ